MAVRPIDAIELQRRMCALCNQDYSDEPCEPSDCVFIRVINEMPTLTPPNEPLTCDGCDMQSEKVTPCASCIRDPRVCDYYTRRPPEGH